MEYVCEKIMDKTECENMEYCKIINNKKCIIDCDKVNKTNCKNNYFHEMCTQQCIQYRALHAIFLNNAQQT